jgi:hypothetical protein
MQRSPWSSAAAHAAGHGDPLVDGALWSEVRATGGWAYHDRFPPVSS